MMKRRTLVLLGTAALLLGALPASAGTATATGASVITGPGGKSGGYLTPVVVVSKGGSITYSNFDVERHDVVQDVGSDRVHGSSTRPWCALFPRHKCPIFYSRLIGFGQSEAVRGLRYVKPGAVYTFYCTLHPWM